MSKGSAVLIAIGNELLLGQTQDTNSAWLAERLAAVGIRTKLTLTVGDDVAQITWAFRHASEQAEVVIATGGLGPTPDDLTREGLAEAMGVSLVENAACLEQIKAYFARRGRPMRESNRRQALIPVGAEPIENTGGTAPGIRARVGQATVYVTPGVPREMREMFDRSIQPDLPADAAGRAIVRRTILAYGAGESDIAGRISDLMQRGRNPLVGTTPHETIISVRIVAEADSADQAERLAERDAAEVRRRLGDLVFGEGEATLADAVADLLLKAASTVATAESCTAGLLAKMLTDVSGSSGYFLRGYITYSNESKIEMLGVPPEMIERHGAVSEQVARAMASRCKAAARADYAIAITGIAGPTGGTAEKPVGLVYVGLAGPAGCEVGRFNFGEHLLRWQVRDRACKAALNMLRLTLLKK